MEARNVRGIAASLADHRKEAMLYRDLATLRVDVPLSHDLADLEWRGVPREEYLALCVELGLRQLIDRPHRWNDR